MPDPTPFDILILGSGPAGASAALFAARQGRRVQVIDRRTKDDTTRQPEWLHPDGHKLLADAGVDPTGALLGRIQRVRFIDAVAGRQAAADLATPVDIVDAAALNARITATATAAGTTFQTGITIQRIDAREKSVTLIDHRKQSWEARLLLLADGVVTLGRTLPSLHLADESAKAALALEWTGPRADGKKKSDTPTVGELALLISAQDPGSYGYAVNLPNSITLGWVGRAPGERARRSLSDWIRRAGELGIAHAPADAAALAHARLVPRGLALEMETHVAKHALLLGDAGGFVSALSHEGLYPALRTSQIAADTVHAALNAPQPQDTLAGFDAAWRGALVDHLRIPNTDLRFLIPLVFSNAVMAKKLAEAFAFGTNI